MAMKERRGLRGQRMELQPDGSQRRPSQKWRSTSPWDVSFSVRLSVLGNVLYSSQHSTHASLEPKSLHIPIIIGGKQDVSSLLEEMSSGSHIKDPSRVGCNQVNRSTCSHMFYHKKRARELEMPMPSSVRNLHRSPNQYCGIPGLKKLEMKKPQ